MKKSIYSQKHHKLCVALAEARKKAGLTQIELAEKISKPQSFIAKYEGGERRLDIIELLEITQHVGISIPDLLKKIY